MSKVDQDVDVEHEMGTQLNNYTARDEGCSEHRSTRGTVFTSTALPGRQRPTTTIQCRRSTR